jgi:hypothetical protein
MGEETRIEKEKRKAIRVAKPLAVQYAVKKDGSSALRWDMSLMKDISERGCCIRTDEVYPKDDVFNLRIRMPTSPTEYFEVTAKVIDSGVTRGRICTTRLEFFNLTEDQQRLVRDFVAWALEKEREA